MVLCRNFIFKKQKIHDLIIYYIWISVYIIYMCCIGYLWKDCTQSKLKQERLRQTKAMIFEIAICQGSHMKGAALLEWTGCHRRQSNDKALINLIKYYISTTHTINVGIWHSNVFIYDACLTENLIHRQAYEVCVTLTKLLV